MFYNVDGGLSRISSSDTAQGAHLRRFQALMVDATWSPTPAPPRGGGRRLPLQLPKKIRKDVQGKRYVGPTCGFAASSEVGPGTTVGTL
jgi:hypothetical protein